ncbi:MAG: ABC transporter permease, partial [Achromobacter pestifer]
MTATTASGAAGAPASKPPRKFNASRFLPLIGPLALFVVWDLVVRLQLVSPVLLPTPSATLVALVKGLAGGPLLWDFLSSLNRT